MFVYAGQNAAMTVDMTLLVIGKYILPVLLLILMGLKSGSEACWNIDTGVIYYLITQSSSGK